ncbi:uncharacterized protein LOC112258133 isoform X2 [Oncorhynchus tshawytscha]|uniref:uncharacterized protein LOC112258133 isoform X2 n=1 Tax=Oncorhynchus tshawytscha TaxID=74940 RepID=UPI000D09BC61|nr:uncharacterized protein LOC112258133 isoform X2 [Oncorhynchus tshawytscha]
MKTAILLLSVAMVLFDSGTLPANAAAHRQHRSHDSNLEAIISMAGQYTHTLSEELLETLLIDVTHLTATTTKCKEFFCEAEKILASVKNDVFGEEGKIVRHLRVYNKLKCTIVKSQDIQVEGNQVELRRLLLDLKECGQKINSKP